MTDRFVSLDTYDVRFPTSRELDGSDAMNADPDYSAAYVVLRTDATDATDGDDDDTDAQGTGSRSRSAAATRCRPPRSRRCGRISSDVR